MQCLPGKRTMCRERFAKATPRAGHRALRIRRLCRGQCRTSEGQQREIPPKAGYSGAPLRHLKAWLGVLLHAAEGQREGVRGVRADLHELCRRHAMWHNLRRVLSIIGVRALLERLEGLFFSISRLSAWRVGLRAAGSGRWYGALWAGRAA